MTTIVSPFYAIAIILSLLLHAGAAEAAQAWVSGAGNDSNSCSRTSPCATFAKAYAAAGDPGEINVLDGGDFGPLTIGHSLTIANDGAGTATNSPLVDIAAIAIEAGATDGDVVLRGLNLNNTAGNSFLHFGGPAIDFISGASLLVDHCTIQNFRSNAGILFEPSSFARLWVKDTVLSTNGASSGASVWIKPSNGQAVKGQFERVQILESTGNGIRVDGTGGGGVINIVLHDVTVDGATGGSGIVAVSNASGGPAVNLTADEVTASNDDGYGVRAVGGTARVFLRRSTIVGNGVGVGASSGGVVYSYGDNSFADNTDGDGSPTPVALK